MERRLAWIVGSLLATVLMSGVAAATDRHSDALIPLSAQPQTVSAVDLVAPTPTEVIFAKPQASTRRLAPAPRSRRLFVRPAVAPVVAVTASDPTCSGASWRERRGQAALAALLHPAPVGVSMSFLPGGGALKGMTYYDRHHVDVYVGSCDAESAALLGHVVAHELGHAWDSLHMTDALRADYLASRGLAASTPWFGCDACQDFATPAGDFAETYAQWQRSTAESRSRLAAPATPGQLAELGTRFFS